jgi:hypothetical protein
MVVRARCCCRRVLAMAAASAAGYHLLQLLKCLYLGRRRSGRALAWTCLLLDKVSGSSSSYASLRNQLCLLVHSGIRDLRLPFDSCVTYIGCLPACLPISCTRQPLYCATPVVHL